eukprot:2842269-Prymnesium_polylepis.1
MLVIQLAVREPAKRVEALVVREPAKRVKAAAGFRQDPGRPCGGMALRHNAGVPEACLVSMGQEIGLAVTGEVIRQQVVLGRRPEALHDALMAHLLGESLADQVVEPGGARPILGQRELERRVVDAKGHRALPPASAHLLNAIHNGVALEVVNGLSRRPRAILVVVVHAIARSPSATRVGGRFGCVGPHLGRGREVL